MASTETVNKLKTQLNVSILQIANPVNFLQNIDLCQKAKMRTFNTGLTQLVSILDFQNLVSLPFVVFVYFCGFFVDFA